MVFYRWCNVRLPDVYLSVFHRYVSSLDDVEKEQGRRDRHDSSGK